MHNWRWISPYQSSTNIDIEPGYFLPKFGHRLKIFLLLDKIESFQILELTFSGITRSSESPITMGVKNILADKS